MIARIQVRRGTAAAWASANPVLGSGEPGYETDTGKFKIGDGTAAWNNLDYQGGGASLNAIPKSANFTAEAGNTYSVDTSGGAVTVTLPASPAAGETVVSFADAQGTWADNNLILNRNGNKIFGRAENFNLRMPALLATLIYIDEARGWAIFTGMSVPIIATAPAITGTAKEYQTLTCSQGTWINSPTEYRYQWESSDDRETGWADIDGASSSAYAIPVTTYTGKFLRCGVIATSAAGDSDEVFSEATVAVEESVFPASGLEAFWKLSDLTDSTGNGNTLTNTGGVTFAAGKVGNGAVCVKATPSYLKETSAGGGLGSITGTGWSLSFWYKGTAGQTGPFVVACDDVDAAGFYFVDGNNGSILILTSSDWGGIVLGPSPDRLLWHHFVLTVNTSGTLKCYLDGSLVSTQEGVDWDDGHIVFGKHLWDSTASDGTFDAAGVWNRPLTADEVGDLYAGGAGQEYDLLAGIQAFWRLSDVTDSSGNGRTLTNVNAVTFVAGKIGNAANFSSSYLWANPFVGLGDTFTISAWVNCPLTTEMWIVAQYPDCLAAIRPDGEIVISDVSLWEQSSATGVVPANTWTHIVLRVMDGIGSVYVNGNLTPVVTASEGNLMKLDTDNGSRGFGLDGEGESGGQGPGKLDAVGVWDRALSDGEIALLYDSGTGIEL